MKKITILILVSVFFFYCRSNSGKKAVLGEQPLYKVMKTSETMKLDGLMNEAIWQSAETRTFDYFYRTEFESDSQKTLFRMLWDEENIYLFYEFEDTYLTARETKRDGFPFFDDCAEIFIIPAPDSLDSHFGFEINIYKAMNDFVYFNKYYKENDYVLKSFNSESCSAITFQGTLNDNSDKDESWKMEICIPLVTFHNLWGNVKNLEGTQWAFQAARQDRNDLEGERRSISTLFPIYDESLGVHQANRFGLMEFQK